MHIVVGTAGHIDHGKTSLVKALTGTDTDRLPEEKRRGITIDLGFAEMARGDARVSFVDVPGHERFVRNMLAGASGIDAVLLVIAADEGVMPQTREHFDICRLLHIGRGIVALTKTDLADAETIELARLEVAELAAGTFLEAAPVFEVSTRSGSGIDDLKAALLETAGSSAKRPDRLITRLPIDRSFSVRGFGAVATGTLASGTIRPGDELELLPGGRRLRVRGVQTHGEAVDQAPAGRRTAVNLGGIDHHEIRRGMLLAEPGVLRPGQIFDTEIEVLPSAAKALRSRQRVRLSIGTAEVLARLAVVGEMTEIAPGEKGFAQLRLESPIAAVAGERFILRTYSPQTTVGGGTIIRPAAEKFRRKDREKLAATLGKLSEALPDETAYVRLTIEAAGKRGSDLADIRAVTGWRSETAVAAVEALTGAGSIVEAGGIFLAHTELEDLKSRTVSAVEAHHRREPLARGLPREELREKVFRRSRPEIEKAVVSMLAAEGSVAAERDVVKIASHTAQLSPQEKAAVDAIRAAYTTAGLEMPKLDDVLAAAGRASSLGPAAVRKVFQLFLDSGEIVPIGGEYFALARAIDGLRSAVRGYAERTPGRTIDVAAFKELTGLSRKYAIPLLEYFDRTKVTARRGDARIVL